jgi:hypothetical protein
MSPGGRSALSSLLVCSSLIILLVLVCYRSPGGRSALSSLLVRSRLVLFLVVCYRSSGGYSGFSSLLSCSSFLQESRRQVRPYSLVVCSGSLIRSPNNWRSSRRQDRTLYRILVVYLVFCMSPSDTSGLLFFLLVLVFCRSSGGMTRLCRCFSAFFMWQQLVLFS